jgi:hypothetical protein
MDVKSPADTIRGKMSEQKLLDKVLERYRAAYDMKDSYNIRENIKLFNDYWSGEKEIEDGISNTNIVQAIIESQVADLTKEDLDVEAFGVEPSDEPWAEDVEMVCDWIWYRNKMVPKIDGAERERLVQGTVGWKVYFDHDALRGKGLITIDYCGLETLFPDPKVTDPFKIQEGDFFIHVQTKPLSFFRRTFGARGKLVKPEGGFQHYDHRVLEKLEITDKVMSDQATLYEYWEKDDDLNLRLIYCTQDMILYDSHWDTKESYLEHGKYPFVLIPCYKCKGRIWGKGDVEQLISVQNVIDDLDDQIIINARQTANNQIVVGKGSGINPKTWTNEPGLKIPATDVSAWKQIIPVNIPMYVLSRREKAFEEAELVSGRPDVLEGRRSGSLRAASAIIALQEAGQRRGNHKSLMLAEGLTQVEELVVDTSKEFMTEETAFKITNNGQTTYKWFRPSDLKEIPVMIPFDKAKAEHEETEDFMPDIESNMADMVPLLDENGETMTKDADFDLKITIGAGMPHNKSFMYQATLELFREGLITQEEGREILKRVMSFPVIDPYNPQGQFTGRNLSPELANMMNGQAPEAAQGGNMPDLNQLLMMLQGGMGGQSAQGTPDMMGGAPQPMGMPQPMMGQQMPMQQGIPAIPDINQLMMLLQLLQMLGGMQGMAQPQQMTQQMPGQLPPDLAGLVGGTNVGI